MHWRAGCGRPLSGGSATRTGGDAGRRVALGVGWGGGLAVAGAGGWDTAWRGGGVWRDDPARTGSDQGRECPGLRGTQPGGGGEDADTGDEAGARRCTQGFRAGPVDGVELGVQEGGHGVDDGGRPGVDARQLELGSPAARCRCQVGDQRSDLLAVPQYPEDMASDEYGCPVCGRLSEQIVRRHKTPGVFVPPVASRPVQESRVPGVRSGRVGARPRRKADRRSTRPSSGMRDALPASPKKTSASV